ncbi:MAG: 50S ribosomal protein L7Ae-like protein [Firmicutes bacterium]|jgi:large subunit ribosomal protein L7A|nr:50S ribosomal protein L7Ae-like protein [Bacillota bacterium]
MALESLRTARQKTIGTKQTLKAVEKGLARKVYVASDADAHIVAPLLELCASQGIQYEYVESMRELGRACGIQVGAAAAAITD